MTNFIVAGILLIIVGAAIIYIIRAKKKGKKCIGCPAGGHCSSQCDECVSACEGHNQRKENSPS